MPRVRFLIALAATCCLASYVPTPFTPQLGGTGTTTGAASGLLAAVWSSQAVAALGDTIGFGGALKSPSFTGKVRQITCSWTTLGVCTACTNAVIMQVYDVTTSTSLCTCSLGANCAVAVGTVETCNCNSAAMTAGDVYAMQFSSGTGCTTNPAGVTCSTELVTP